MANNYKLTKKDKEILLNVGYSQDDLSQIEEGINIGKITHEKRIKGTRNYKEKEIGIKTAIKYIGKKQFLYSCGRASFHWNTSEQIKDCSEEDNSYLQGYSDEVICFDFSKLFV